MVEEGILYMRVPYPDESGEDWYAIPSSNQVQKDGDGFLIPAFHISPRPYSAAVAVDTCIFLLGGLDGDLPPVGRRTCRKSLREVSIIDTRQPQRGLFAGPSLRLPQTAMNCFCFCGHRHDLIYMLPRICSSNTPPEVLHCLRYPRLGDNNWRPLRGGVAAVMDDGTATVKAVEYRSFFTLNRGAVSVPHNLFFTSEFSGILHYNLRTNSANPPLTETAGPALSLSRGVCRDGVIYFYVGFNGEVPAVWAYCLTLRKWYPKPGVLGFEKSNPNFVLPYPNFNNRPNPLVDLGSGVLCFMWICATNPFSVGVVKFKIKLRINRNNAAEEEEEGEEWEDFPYARVKSISYFKLRSPSTSLLDYLLVCGSGKMRLLNRMEYFGSKRKKKEMKERRKLQSRINSALYTIPEAVEEEEGDEI
nr:hypothetical protein Iba_chr02eCG2680 [Ipomoea batatas]